MSMQQSPLRTAPQRATDPAPPERRQPTEAAQPTEPVLSPARRRALTLLTVLPPAAVALYRCLDGIGSRQLWRDEHASWWAAALSFQDLRALLGTIDAVIAPYYLLLRLWIAGFGDSAASLRTPSALAMALAAAVTAVLGRQLATRAGVSSTGLAATLTGLGAGLAFALLPAVARYGQEARPYAFSVLAVLVSTLLLLRALEQPSVARWAWYATSVTLVGAAHLVSLLVLAAHLIAALTLALRARERAAFWQWALAALVGVGGIAALLLRGNGQSKQIAWNNPTLDDLTDLPKELFGSWTTAAVVLGLAVIGLWPARRHAGLLVCWIVLPPVLTYVTADRLHLFLDRYLLFVLAPCVLLAAAGVGWLLSPVGRSAVGRVVAGVLAVALLGGVAVLGQPTMATLRDNLKSEPDYRGAADLLAAQTKPGDGMVINSLLNARRALAYELRDRQAPTDILLQYYPEDLGRFQGVECTDPSECARFTDRLWLVSTAIGPNPLAQLPKNTQDVLTQQFKTVDTKQLHGLKLVLLERIQPAPGEE
ncbi:glycosyltransferase family 39 protein [Kitasatospora sp. P5_F3]